MKAMQTFPLSLFAVCAGSVHAASLPVSLYTSDLTLSRTKSVHVQFLNQDGTRHDIDFTRDDLSSGVTEKTTAVTVWSDVATCKASWFFEPLKGDIAPLDASVDNIDFDCTFNDASGTVEVIPLTAVKALTIDVPEAAFSSRQAAALNYTLNVSQIHGAHWMYPSVSKNINTADQDKTSEYIAFTTGCLTYDLVVQWTLRDGTRVQDESRLFMGENYIIE